MITKNNFKDLLIRSGYEETSGIFEKNFQPSGVSLIVDFNKNRMVYPEQIKGRDRNTSFDKPENFVVFECIDRLLSKGYHAEHLELEKQWSLGHKPKGGRADICVYDNDGFMLMIIECKTWGKEFNKALQDTKNDGAQLFSYWQQDQSTKWLVLYSSNYIDGKIEYEAPSISCIDDENVISSSKKDSNVRLYRNATDANCRFEVWRDTYSNKMYGDLIFSSDSVAYNIGVKPIFKKDLKELTKDKEKEIVNEFDEILRHNSVSDKENAFDRLVALFVCKLVDESTKNDDDEVEFQYKQGIDTYESLQDRLQRLYRDGMEKYLHENIIYVPSDYPEQLFIGCTGSKRNKAIEDLRDTIRILKYYSNNVFSFKDVHNEELFYQNGKILVEIIQLFEKYKIIYPSKNNSLVNLFEELLHNGFRQKEGQFFTPLPITRFIWDCLPLKQIMCSNKGVVYPKVIDYACGAGHFLTESIDHINYYAKSIDNSWARDCIYGVEKDYRLARVAKMSLFMNGAGDGNIIYGDSLEKFSDKSVCDNSFDILVSNPPHSVIHFKRYLRLKNNQYSVLDKNSNDSKCIETLFVERITQLLKPRGIAAVILPESVLFKGDESYIFVREHILKNYFVHGIVSFGCGTFAEANSRVLVLFIERFNDRPKFMNLITDVVDAIFEKRESVEWEDESILNSYLEHINVDIETYRQFIEKKLTYEDLEDSDYFKIYLDDSGDISDIKELEKSKSYKKMGDLDKSSMRLRTLYNYILKVEKEKLTYFSLVCKQKTVVVTSPEKIDDQKEFLGYEWKGSVGNKKIWINVPGGKLYDDSDYENTKTISGAIRQSFIGPLSVFTKEQMEHLSYCDLKDLLVFSKSNFKKEINLSSNVKIEYSSKYKAVPLNSVAEVSKGTAITRSETKSGEFKVVAGGIDYAYLNGDYNRESEIITVSASGVNAGYVNYWDEKIFASDCTTVRSDNKVTTKWIYYYLKNLQSQIYEKLRKGSAQPHVYAGDIKSITIPNIDDSLQKQIVDECEAISEEEKKLKEKISWYRQTIGEKFSSHYEKVQKDKVFNLSDRSKFEITIGKRILKKELVEDGDIPVYSSNVHKLFGNIDKSLKKAKIIKSETDSIIWGLDGNWETNIVSKETEFCPTDHCGVIICKTKEMNPKYLAHILEMKGNEYDFDRTYRPSIERIGGIRFNAPDVREQDKIINEICDYEKNIDELNNQLNDIYGQLSTILDRYLR